MAGLNTRSLLFDVGWATRTIGQSLAVPELRNCVRKSGAGARQLECVPGGAADVAAVARSPE